MEHATAAERSHTDRRVVKTAVRTVLEGKRTWGVLEVPTGPTAGPRGWGRYRLVLLPPGTNSAERRALTVSRHWTFWGLFPALGLEAVTGSVWSPGTGLAVGALLYCAGIAVGFVATRRIRKGIRTVSMMRMIAGGHVETYGDVELFVRTATALDDLDEQQRAGLLTPVQYELGWAKAYEALAA